MVVHAIFFPLQTRGAMGCMRDWRPGVLGSRDPFSTGLRAYFKMARLLVLSKLGAFC